MFIPIGTTVFGYIQLYPSDDGWAVGYHITNSDFVVLLLRDKAEHLCEHWKGPFKRLSRVVYNGSTAPNNKNHFDLICYVTAKWYMMASHSINYSHNLLFLFIHVHTYHEGSGDVFFTHTHVATWYFSIKDLAQWPSHTFEYIQQYFYCREFIHWVDRWLQTFQNVPRMRQQSRYSFKCDKVVIHLLSTYRHTEKNPNSV